MNKLTPVEKEWFLYLSEKPIHDAKETAIWNGLLAKMQQPIAPQTPFQQQFAYGAEQLEKDLKKKAEKAAKQQPKPKAKRSLKFEIYFFLFVLGIASLYIIYQEFSSKPKPPTEKRVVRPRT